MRIYDTIVVMTADMLETGMVFRSATGTEYTIRVDHNHPDGILVYVDWGTITFTRNAVGCNFLTSYERSSDYGLETPPMWFMFAADEMGSIAEMPILETGQGEAETVAREWLDTYDHGFDQAIVVGLDVQHAWQDQTTQWIWSAIMDGRPSKHLL